MKAQNNDDGRRIWTMVKILIVLFIFSILIAAIYSGDDDTVIGYNTAVIPVIGEITTGSGGGLFSDETAGSTSIVQEIERASQDKNVKAIIFEINSPGGSPVATDEIATAIAKANEDGIVTVAWIRESGASGAYWIASSTNHIVANRMSVVGSIGVYGSYVEYSGLMKRYNVTYERLVAGEYKDAGTPLRKLTTNEEIMIQEKLDKLHTYFIDSVAENRNMDKGVVRALATGEIYLGVEAKNNGLIDELGGKEEAVKYIENQLNTTVTTKEFSESKSFIESIMSAMNKNSYYIGQGIASGIVLDSNNLKIKT